MPRSRIPRLLMGLLVLVIVAGLIMSTCSIPVVA
jgi:hypothetical protein